ncbi:MAG TPA: hypothetical protein VKO62_10140 [Solirubrobacterales bacterium]|nr:hypothetical protein [Solirubrobacterales bacterium]
MTSKEKLHNAVDDLSEAEAQEALGYILRRRRDRDELDALLDAALEDDEPTTAEEDEGAREARAEVARGDVYSADEIKREIG